MSDDIFCLRSRTSRSDPIGLDGVEAFWNSRSQDLTTMVP